MVDRSAVLTAVREYVYSTHPDVPRDVVSDDTDLYAALADSMFSLNTVVFVRSQVGSGVTIPARLLVEKHFSTIALIADLIVSLSAPDEKGAIAKTVTSPANGALS